MTLTAVAVPLEPRMVLDTEYRSRKVYKLGRGGEKGREEWERWKEAIYTFLFFQLETIAGLYMFSCSLRTQEKVGCTTYSTNYQKTVHLLSWEYSDPV